MVMSAVAWKEGKGVALGPKSRKSSPAVMAWSLRKFSPSFFRDVISEFLSDRVWHSTWL